MGIHDRCLFDLHMMPMEQLRALLRWFRGEDASNPYRDAAERLRDEIERRTGERPT